MHLPNIHVFHAHYHVIVGVQECSVERHDIVGMAAVHDLKLPDDSFPHLRLGFNVYDL